MDLPHWPTRTLNFDYIIFIAKCGSPQPWLPNCKCTFNFSLAKWVFNMVSSKSNAIEIEHKVGMYKSNNSILSLSLPNYCRLSYIVFFFFLFLFWRGNQYVNEEAEKAEILWSSKHLNWFFFEIRAEMIGSKRSWLHFSFFVFEHSILFSSSIFPLCICNLSSRFLIKLFFSNFLLYSLLLKIHNQLAQVCFAPKHAPKIFDKTKFTLRKSFLFFRIIKNVLKMDNFKFTEKF